MSRKCEDPKTPVLTVQIQSAGRMRLIGELDRATRGLVEGVMVELTGPELLVDVEQLRFADAAGLAVLAAEDARRRALHGRVALFGATPFLRRVLRAAGLSHLLPWHDKPVTDEHWRAAAACRDVPAHIFFDQPVGGEIAAKGLCFECPVAGPCLAYALRTDQRAGVWGGLTAGERSLLKRPGSPVVDCRGCQVVNESCACLPMRSPPSFPGDPHRLRPPGRKADRYRQRGAS